MAPGPDITTDEGSDPSLDGATLAAPARAAPPVRSFRVSVVEGADKALARESSEERLGIGSHSLNDLVIDDPTVSRFHCEIRIEAGAAVVADMQSKNGTFVDGLQVREAILRSGAQLRLGRVVLRFEYGAEHAAAASPAVTRFGALAGISAAMGRTIALLQRAAQSDATVLLEGETGTGKGKAAEELHRAGARRERPFIVVDCGSISAGLLESELFGHEKGSFTGADRRRIGAFEEASGGTVFLDEIGEMPADLQPKLLRALENREIRRVGSNKHIPVDLRVIAATNRDLRAEVNASRFRSDLYFRIAVVKIPLPPLRQRGEDIPAIAAALLREMGVSDAAAARLLTPAFVAELQRMSWPGNARELRNHLARALVFAGDAPDVGPAPAPPDAPVLPFSDARRSALDLWERGYLEELMGRFPGKVAEAARAAGVDRVYLYRLLRRQGLKP